MIMELHMRFLERPECWCTIDKLGEGAELRAVKIGGAQGQFEQMSSQ